jgi:hypothetical protein
MLQMTGIILSMSYKSEHAEEYERLVANCKKYSRGRDKYLEKIDLTNFSWVLIGGQENDH